MEGVRRKVSNAFLEVAKLKEIKVKFFSVVRSFGSHLTKLTYLSWVQATFKNAFLRVSMNSIKLRLSIIIPFNRHQTWHLVSLTTMFTWATPGFWALKYKAWSSRLFDQIKFIFLSLCLFDGTKKKKKHVSNYIYWTLILPIAVCRHLKWALENPKYVMCIALFFYIYIPV